MRLATFIHDGQRRIGRVDEAGALVHAFELSDELSAFGVLSVLDGAALAAAIASEGAPIAIGEVTLEAPIPRPRRNLFCVGRNYRAHAQELSASVFKANSEKTDEWPIVFTKVPECVVGPSADVMLPTHVSRQIDYEAELAVVIGTGGRDIARADASTHIFGYTIVNDVTARDVQMRHGQWDLGKSFDTFCPMGPWIVTADAFDLPAARVRCWVNGELRQDGSVQDLIFDIPTLIETCSRGITLYPGDIIATGTPAGVGMGFSPPRYLSAGDDVRISIDGIGQIQNRFV